MKKIGEDFDRGDLARYISEQTLFADAHGEPWPEGYIISERDALSVLKIISSAIPDAIAEFGRVEIKDLGVFTIERRAADSGVTPDGERWETPERNKIVFRPSPAFKQIIAERTGMAAY